MHPGILHGWLGMPDPPPAKTLHRVDRAVSTERVPVCTGTLFLWYDLLQCKLMIGANMPSNFNFAEYAANRRANDAAAQMQQQSAPSAGGFNNAGGFNFQDFLQQKYMIDQALSSYDGSTRGLSSRNNRPFDVSGGTENLYNSWQKANALDTLAIAAEQGGEWWNNLPGQIAGAFGGEQAKKDWTFDASKFNLLNGFDAEDATQARNFITSLPGMMVGGVLEGVGDLYEGISGRPINEYRKAKDGTWELPEYELDASQRAADLLDAAINLVGTFTGGAGRVVGGLGKAGAKAALGQAGRELARAEARGASQAELRQIAGNAFENATKRLNDARKRQDLIGGMSKGVVTRALEGTAGRKLGTAAGIFADMGDEAAEEFVQSYAEDVRNKNIDEGSFERALTGAAWGAAGGGIMGGVGRAVSHFSDLGKSGGSSENDGLQSDPDTFETVDNPYNAIRMASQYSDMYMNSDGADEMNNRNKNRRLARAASVYKMTRTDQTLGTGQIDLGTWNIREMFYNSQEDADALCDIFETDYANLEQILNGNNVAESLNNLIAARKRPSLQVCVGRNPDTKNGGFLMDVRKFVDGQCFALHPIVANIVGSDWDGDTSSVYLDPNHLSDELEDENGGRYVLQPNGYFSEMLFDPERRSNIEWIWGGISTATRLGDEERVRSFVNSHLENLPGNPTIEYQGQYVPLARGFNGRLHDIFELTSKDDRDNALSELFHDTYESIKETGNSQVRTITESLLNDLLADEELLVQAELDYWADAYVTNVLSFLGYDSKDDPNLEIARQEIRSSLENDWDLIGTTGGSTKAFQMTKALGLLTYLSDPNSKYNPIYRQYAGLKFSVNSVEALSELSTALSDVVGVEPVTTSILRAAFRIAKPGVDPTTAIESMCDKMFLAELSQRTNFGSTKLNSAADINNFKKVFIQLQSKYARIYNEAHKEITSKGVELNKESGYRNPIDGKEYNGKEYEIEFTGEISSEMDAMFWRQFHRCFEETDARAFLTEQVCERLGILPGESFGNFCEVGSRYTMAETVNQSTMALEEQFPDVAAFVRSAVNTYGNEVVAIGKSAYDAIGNGFDFSNALQRRIANGYKWDPMDVPMLLDYFNFLYRWIGAQNCLNLGLVLSDDLPDTRIGQMLFSSDPDERINVVCSLSIYSQYIDSVTAFFHPDDSISDIGAHNIAALANISPVHEMISYEILENDNTRVLEWVTDLNQSMKSKIAYFNADASVLYKKEAFIANCLQSESGKFAISSVSAKNTRAEQSRLLMDKKNYYGTYLHENEAFLTKIKEAVANQRVSQDDFVGWFLSRGKQAAVALNTDILAMKAAAALTVNGSYIEKATIPDLYSMLFDSAELAEEGGLSSALSHLTGSYSGHIDRAQWFGNREHVLACATDPNYACWVWDPSQKKHVLMTQESLFNSCGVEFSHGMQVTSTHIEALFKTYPQIAGYFCNPTTNVSYFGGEPTVSLARENMLFEDFLGYITDKRGSVRTQNQYEGYMNNAIRHIQSEIPNDPRAQACIIAMAHASNPELFEGQLNLREISSAISKASDEYARFVLDYHLNGGVDLDGPGLFGFDGVQGKIYSQAQEELASEMFSAISTFLDMAKLDINNGLQSSTQEELARGIANFMASTFVTEETGIPVDAQGHVADYEAAINKTVRTVSIALSLINHICEGKFDLFSENLGQFIATYADQNAIISSMSDRIQRAAEDEYRDQNPNATVAEIADAMNARSDEFRSTAEQQYMQSVLNADYRSMIDFSALDINNLLLHEEDFRVLPDGSIDIAHAAARIQETMGWSYDFQVGMHRNPHYAIDLVTSIYPSTVNYVGSTGSTSRGDILERINEFNTQIVQHLIRELCAETHIPLNDNAFGMANQLSEFLTQSAQDILVKMGSDPKHKDALTWDAVKLSEGFKEMGWQRGVVPRMSFDSQTLQSILSNMMAADPAAGNARKVGFNGLEQSKAFPTSHLPARIEDIDAAIATGVTKEEIEDDFCRYRDLNVMINGEDGAPRVVAVSSREFRTLLQEATPDTSFQVFLPENNPHGLPTYNMPMAATLNAPGKEYHRLSGILSRICQFSMEAMVMKTKKLLRITDHIADINFMRSAQSNHIYTSQFETINAHFHNYRRMYAASLRYEFLHGEMRSLGFGHDQALILSQALTPGVLLDVEYEDGSRGQIMADAALFFDSQTGRAVDKFSEFINTATSQDGSKISQVKGAEIATLTVSSLGDRIMERINSAQGGADNLDVAQTERLAVQALSDFSDYTDSYTNDRGAVRTLMSKLPPVALSGNGSIRAIDNQTSPQALIAAITDQTFGNSIIQQHSKPATMLIRDTEDWKKASSIGAHLGLIPPDEMLKLGGYAKGTGYAVTKVWSGPKPRFRQNEDVWNLLQSAEYSCKEISGNYSGTYGILYSTDPEDFKEALSWAMSTRGILLITKDVQDSLVGSIMPGIAVKSSQYRLKNGASTQELFKLDLSDYRRLKTLMKNTPKTYQRRRSLDSIRMTCIVDSESAMPAHIREMLSGDSAKQLFRRGRDSLVRAPWRVFDYPLSDIFPRRCDLQYEKSFVTADEADALLSQIARNNNGTYIPIDDDRVFEAAGIVFGDKLTAGRRDTRELRQEVVDYLVDIRQKNYDRDLPNRPHPKTGGVAALVKSGPFIAPVVYPEIPAYVDASLFSIGQDGKVYVSLTGRTPMYTESMAGSTKTNIAGEAAKGTASAATRLDLAPAVRFANGDGVEIHESLPSESEASRVGGFETQMLADTLYFVRALTDSSLFFEERGDGVYAFKGEIANWSNRDKGLLLSGTATYENLWNRVINGQLNLTRDDERNRVIQKVFSELKNQGVNPLEFFSNYRVSGAYVSDSGDIQHSVRRNFAKQPGRTDVGYVQFNHRSLLQNLEYGELLLLFNTVDDSICASGFSDPRSRENRTAFVVGADGRVLVDWGTGDACEMYVRFGGQSQILGDLMYDNLPGGSASVSAQHYGARASDIGYTDRTLAQGIADNNLTMENYDIALDSYQRRSIRKMTREERLPNYERPIGMQLGSMWHFASKADRNEARATAEMHKKTFTPGARKILRNGAKPNDADKFIRTRDDLATSSFSNLISTIEREMDPDARSMWSVDMYNQLAMAIMGVSWSEDISDELKFEGQWIVTEKQMETALMVFIDSMIHNDRHLPSIISQEDTSDVHNRYQMGLVPVHIARALWFSFPSVRETYGDFESFGEAMRDEQMNRADRNIESISINQKGGSSKKIALRRMANGLYANWGYPPNVYNYGGSSIAEIDSDINSLADQFTASEHWTIEQRRLFRELVQMSNRKYEALSKHLQSLGYLQVETDYMSGTEIKSYNKVQEAKDIVNLLNNLAEASKVMAVLNPFLTVGNLTDRYFHQGSARLWLWLGNSLRIGPYKSNRDHIVDKDIRKMSVNGDMAIALYQSYREMEFDSQETAMVLQLVDNNNIEAALDFVQKRKEQKLATIPGKLHEWAFKSASGGQLGIKMQMETIIDRFVQFVEEHGGIEAEFWFSPTDQYKENGQPMTRLEAMLNSPGGFAQFMAYCLGPNSISYSSFMQAMNFAKAGDIAQKNSVGAVIGEICRHVPFGNFIMTTCISRFPTYGLNVTGRILNYVLPISTMYRSFNEFMAKTDLGKGLGIEEMNIHTSMREAIMVDMCKLGVGGCAIVLFAMSGALQPPDDERKWGNVDEWLVFGTRAGETWWLEDVLGMSLPLACFWKACEQGKPRYDILFNGVANACYSNPMLRCGDIASWLMNPAESLVSDYNEEVMQFENAKGGAPSFGQYLQNNAFSCGMNWLTQFCTPSILKEWWRASQPLEKSYKRDWERSASGQITADGLAGKTEYVTYDEAIKRKLAIRNPVLAFLFSIGNKSYMPADMPDTVYYDEYQLDSNLSNSVVGLDDDEKNVKVNYLIGVLQSYNGNMEEAAKDGLHFDAETLRAIANQVWDNYHQWDAWYNDLQATGQLNYYTLGNGDFEEGKKIAAQLKQERDTQKQYWYDFYYQCLKDSPIAGTLQTYNRYNTSYAADVYGDVYATGMYKSALNMLPFTNAPGTIDNPEGTAGYGNDFTTVSAVTGAPLSQRALIPSDQGRIELPDFESLSNDGEGKQFSADYYDRTGTTPSNTTTSTSYPSNSGGGSGSGGRSGGGGGGGYSRGGSSAPNVYAPSVSLPKGNASRIMNRDRLSRPQYDYLRPDFETKGSREAYKRSDI